MIALRQMTLPQSWEYYKGENMARRIRVQRLGAGSPKYRSLPCGTAQAAYPNLDDAQKNGTVLAEVKALHHDAARSAVLAELLGNDGGKSFIIAAEGLSVNDNIQLGKGADLRIGNIMLLKDIVEGCPVFNIEKTPGDGGQLVRSSGLYALVMTRDADTVYVKLPSGKTIRLHPACRATIGCVAGGGRKEKPLVKAGTKFHKMKVRGKRWKKTRGVAMNPVDHPFGGSQHHVGKSKSTSRHAAAGRKVGAIASSRTGRRKK